VPTGLVVKGADNLHCATCKNSNKKCVHVSVCNHEANDSIEEGKQIVV
jgi:hypothetical protein